MKVTKKLSVFTVLVIAICLLAGSVFAFAADNKVYTIRFAHGLPATHNIAIQYANWAKMIEEESNGQLKIKLYPGGQLFKDNKLISALNTGALEAGAVYSFHAATIVPEFKIFSIPGVLESRDKLVKIIEGEIGKNLFSKLEDKDLKPLGWVDFAIAGVNCGVGSTSPLYVPSDLKGKTVRTTCPEQDQYFQEYCGASSAYISGAELYMALQRGTLNASIVALDHLVDRKLSEVVPYTTLLPVHTTVVILTMNEKFFDSLPEDLQQVILKVTEKVQKESYKRAEYIDIVYTLKVKELLKGRGELHTLTPEEYALWTKDIEGFWKRVTEKNPEVYDLIMEVQNL